MPNEWEATIQIDQALARRLLEEQFPALVPFTLEEYGIGWDNVAYLVNDQLVFRFPRRTFSATLLEREARVLPLIAPSLPVPIPVPTFVGAGVPEYPYTFAGYRRIDGRTACRTACDDTHRAALAPALGSFLRALHSIPIDDATAAWAPGDEIGRTALRERLSYFQERIRINAAGLDADTVQELCDIMEALSWTQPARSLHWIHGDFYGRHLILDDTHHLAGVIDWGDVHRGDPALDLSIAFSFLPPSARPAFRDAYGPIDDDTWARARWRGIRYGALLSEYGANVGDQEIFALGMYALQHTPQE